MALHHTEEEQKRFWELMNRFENEEELSKMDSLKDSQKKK